MAGYCDMVLCRVLWQGIVTGYCGMVLWQGIVTGYCAGYCDRVL